MREFVVWISLALVTTFVAGCSTGDVNGLTTSPAHKSSSSNHTTQQDTGLVIKSITPEANGILVTTDHAVNHLERILVDPHFTSPQGHNPERFTFTLHNVVPGPRIRLNTREDFGMNYLTVERHEDDLVVTYSVVGTPVNQFRIGTDQGKFLGIALEYHPTTQAPPAQSVCNIPAWYFHDLSVAAKANIPMMATTYRHDLPNKHDGYLLDAPPVSKSEEVGLSSYFGPIEVSDIFRSSGGPWCDGITGIQYGNVMEQNGGRSVSVPAMMVGMPNGWALGFAKNQVIISSTHGGMEVYTVYSVPGIEFYPQRSGH